MIADAGRVYIYESMNMVERKKRFCVSALTVLGMLAMSVPGLRGTVIPPERLIDWDAGVRGGIPDVPVVETVPAETLGQRGTRAIEEAMERLQGPGAIFLPEGAYYLEEPIQMRSGVVLRGRGAGKTRLIFALPPPEEDGISIRPAFGAIRIEGTRETREVGIRSGHKEGSRELEVERGHGLVAGELILVYSDNDPELMYTESRWERPWARESMAQIVTLKAAFEERLVIDTPLRLDLKAEFAPRLRRIRPITDAGVEAMTVVGAAGFNDTLIGIEAGLNCWVRDVETAFTGRGHIWINFSRFITVTGNTCHHAYDYGGGGNGYGIVAGNVATDCLVVDNYLHNLRHSMMTKRGSSGNVFAYNYSTAPRRNEPGQRPLCDISAHGHYSHTNLFEGNQVEFVELADFWGPTGPRTTLFRNRVMQKLEVRDHSHDTNLIGNELREGSLFIDETCKDVFLLGNRDAAREPGPESEDLPASLYYQKRPPFWGDLPWPSIGPGTDTERDWVLPAQGRGQPLDFGQIAH